MKYFYWTIFLHSTTACFSSKPEKKPYEAVTSYNDYPTRINIPKKRQVKKSPMNNRTFPKANNQPKQASEQIKQNRGKNCLQDNSGDIKHKCMKELK